MEGASEKRSKKEEEEVVLGAVPGRGEHAGGQTPPQHAGGQGGVPSTQGSQLAWASSFLGSGLGVPAQGEMKGRLGK